MTTPKSGFVIHSAKYLFQPMIIAPKNAEIKRKLLPKSHKLMNDIGIIRQGSNGLFHLLPLGLRALNKLIKLVDCNMRSLGAQKMQLPILTEGSIWKKSGRWDTAGLELFRLRDRHNHDYILSPTHEESIADLMSTVSDITHNKLPILLYQITSKFRDEVKPRCGLLRAREFVMKDLYSFDKSLSDTEITYNNVCSAYSRIFEGLNIPYVKVVGETGDMGGIYSHEYHISSDIGEDMLAICDKCSNRTNTSIFHDDACAVCGGEVKFTKSIEVGHTFLLGTKYTVPLQATFKNAENSLAPLVMGSYGLGLTRILSACIETFSSQDNLRWPLQIAPYSVVIITPKEGSPEASTCGNLVTQIYTSLNSPLLLADDVLLDDRDYLTIGKRIWHAGRTGYPYMIVVGEKATLQPPILELHNLTCNSIEYLTFSELVHFFSAHYRNKDMYHDKAMS